MTKPLVSVLCITYNHVQFIRSCLESLVSQRCDFTFEIIIYDDASTDGTRDIVLEFQKKYPELIRPILREENQWFKNPGVIDILYNNPQAKGEYIAICEGDDFWIGQDKLQKQVGILEKYPECSMTCGAYVLKDDGKEKVVRQNKWLTNHPEDERGKIFELEDLRSTFFIKTSTTLFRNIPSLFDQLNKYDLCLDMHIFYLLLRVGKGYYKREILAGYNKHQAGVYSGSHQQEVLLAQYLILKNMYEIDGDEFFRKKYLKLALSVLNLKISGLMLWNKNIKQKFLQNRNPSVFRVVKDIKPVLQTKVEKQEFYRNLIPVQAKVLKQRIKHVFTKN